MPGFTLIIALLLAVGVASWFLAPRLWAHAILGLWRRSAGLASRFIAVEGIRWHWLKGGSGPSLLLLHGFGADSGNWLRLASILGQRFSLIIPDLPGFGESEPPERLNFGIDAQAARLAQFLDAIGVDRCLVAGSSMGGYLATALAQREPDRVEALWLIAPLGVRSVQPGAVLEAVDSGDLGYLQISSVRQFRKRILPTMFSARPWIPGPLINLQARSAIAIREHAPRMLHEVRFDSEPLESLARRIEQPALVQWGEDDRVVNPAGLAVLGEAFADVRCVLTGRCGHLPMLERSRESARLFLEFLEDRRLC